MTRAIAALYVLVAGLSLAILAWFTLHYAINADNAAMLEYARRMLAGGREGVDYADMNPPLSIIAYLPAAALLRLGMPGWDAFNLYLGGLIAVSALLVWQVARRLGVLERGEIALLVFAYILGNLAIPGISFGERDQLVLLGLLPLLLAQFALAEKIRLPPWLLAACLTAGTIALCLKPHYALTPVALIVWRIAREKRLRILWQADALALGGGALLYAAILLIVFSAYLRGIMPDVVALYAGHVVAHPFPRPLEGLAAAAMVVAAGFGFDGARRRFFLTLALGAAGSYIAYLAQAKGYAYHLIPCSVLAFTAGSAMAATMLRQALPIAAAGSLLLVALYPVHPAYPTHRLYPSLPLAQMVRVECGNAAACPFLVDNEFQFMTDETALYTGTFSASRFPAFWFESALACHQRPDLFAKYAGMVTADLRRWQPVFIALVQSPDHCPGEAGRTASFDFGKFYSQDPAFASEWAHYKFERTATFNRRDYFRGTTADYDHPLTFAIYRRTPERP